MYLQSIHGRSESAFKTLLLACFAAVETGGFSQPLLGRQWPMTRDELGQIAKDAGFEILSMADVYAGHDFRELQISRWDYHPDEFGNQLLADKLYEQMSQSEEFLALLGDD